MYGMLYVLAPARAGAMHKLTFFTHLIDGKLYGAWYRVRSTTEVEVQAVGLLKIVAWEGRSPQAAAQCCLEEFVAQRQAEGEPTPVLDEIAAELEEADVYRFGLARPANELRSATV
jgi:hypothetical protein